MSTKTKAAGAFRQRLARMVRDRRRKRAAKARGGKKLHTKLLLLSLVALLAGFGYGLNYLAPKPEGGKLSLDQLTALAEDQRVVQATFRDEDAQLTGTFTCALPDEGSARAPTCEEYEAPVVGKKLKGRERKKAQEKRGAELPAGVATLETIPTRDFWMPYPQSDLATLSLLEAVGEGGARVSVDPQTPKKNVRLITTFLLPLMVLANLFALLFTAGRGGSSGIGEIIVFGSIGKGKIRNRGKSAAVTFADVAGADEAVTELREVVDYLRAPERYQSIGAQAPKGILMIGPPGCGKTLLAKATAGEAGVPFFSVAGAEFVESLVGVGAARVRDLFQRVRALAPAIVFIDELDAAGRRRGAGGGGGGTDEREQTLNQILVEMDGFDASSGIVVIGATNRPDILDPALLRPGRFDRHVAVDQPDRDGRRAILELHARGRKLQPNVEFERLARRTPGYSGADLANVINEAALLAVRADKDVVGMSELLEAIERVLSGPQRRGRILTPEERRRAAYHESGHAIVTAAVGKADELHRISILSRGKTVGTTSIAAEADAAMLTRSALERRLVIALAGLAAEELALGESSTGVENDLEVATWLARDMVGRWGMSRTLGRARLLAKDSDAILGNDVPFAQLSAATQHEVDSEIKSLLARAEEVAATLLRLNREKLDDLVGRLETEELLEGPALEEAIAGVVTRRIVLDGPGAGVQDPPRRRAKVKQG
ncbi:MAG TPA: ATP-dependent zinc metalloprotease FtsH [Actinomycetota bacterium]